MDSSFGELYRLNQSHLNSAAELFSRAFFDDSLAVWIFPEEGTPNLNLYHYHKFRIKFGILYGEVYAISPNLEGLAVWVYSENIDMTFWRMIRSGGMKLLRHVRKDAIKKMLKISDFVSKLHHKYATFPHMYLSPIGVDPVLQGKGHASRLLRPMFNRLDHENLHCFLETQNKVNVDIYLHYGFEIKHESIIPDTEIEHWLMERKPK